MCIRSRKFSKCTRLRTYRKHKIHGPLPKIKESMDNELLSRRLFYRAVTFQDFDELSQGQYGIWEWDSCILVFHPLVSSSLPKLL